MHFQKAVLCLVLAVSLSAVAQDADLGVEKLGPPEAAAGGHVSYSVTVVNTGPDAAANVVLSDPVPAGMSFVSATQESGPSFACNSVVECTIATLPAGETATFTFVFRIDSGSEFVNTATVTATTPDPNLENDASTTTTTTGTPAQGDLFVQKSGPPATAPDRDVTFVITLGNAGPSAATKVELTDVLPGTITFVSFTQTAGPPMACVASTCTTESFPAGATATFELTGHLSADAQPGTQHTNTAFVTADNDPLDENNSGSATVAVLSADVSIAKTGPPTATAGTTISYDVTVTNHGPDRALNVVIHDPPLCDAVNCTLGPMDPGQSVSFTFEVEVPPGATSQSNTASVSTDSIDPNLANNSSTVNTTVTRTADLGVVKNGPATATAGTNVTYTIDVTNAGPSDAPDVVLTDVLPAGTTLVSFTCGANPCAIGTLAANASVSYTLVAQVAPNATGPLVNTATVTTSALDPASANNTSSVQTAVTRSADVAVVKSGPATVAASTSLTYSITVANNGPSEASDVVLTDVPPAGTTVVSFSCASNPCPIGALAPGASVEHTLTVQVDVTATGPLVNTASVTTSTPDPVPANDTSSVQTAVTPAPADLSITKTADFPQSVVNERATFTIVVRNAGPGEATNVLVTDELPPGTTLLSASPGCTGTTTMTCSAGTLATGASATFAISVRLPSMPGTVTNTARVTSDMTDPAAPNDASTVTIAVALPAQAIPAMSPIALAFLAVTIASVVLVVLRRVS